MQVSPQPLTETGETLIGTAESLLAFAKSNRRRAKWLAETVHARRCTIPIGYSPLRP
jgi:hypothetical protein